MKKYLYIFIFLIGIILVVESCSKDSTPVPVTRSVNTPPASGPLREYYWGMAWQKSATNYELKINTTTLTDSVLNRGIIVHLAIYSDWSPFNRIPLTLNEVGLPDTINLTYTATAGKLIVYAKTPVNITWTSDVSITYQ